MATALRDSARAVAHQDAPARSTIARSMFRDLMSLPPDVRRGFFQAEDHASRTEILRVSQEEAGTPLAMYVDDPVGFVEDVLDESMWSKAKEVARSVAEHRVTAVPSCFGSSKTHTAARLDLWWTMVHAPGTALAVTVAPLWRQVVRQMWPEIRRAHSRANLPGEVATFAMKQRVLETGLEVVTSYGLVANKHDESATQGIHSPHLLLVVDEAGGIAQTVGQNFRAVLTGDDSRALYIGNPPADAEGSWFEGVCNDHVPEDDVNVIVISAHSTPAMTGEKAPRCKSCPAGVPPHTMAKHLVDRKWVDDTVREFGEDSPYVQAKVHAKFPRGGSDRALPYAWVELARDVLDPEDDPEFVTLRELGITEEEPDPNALVKMGSWIRLGVDVASDGGDELVISRAAGDLVTIRHTSSGPTNADPVKVAGKVLAEIKRATKLAKAVGSTYPVRVKVDGIGVGWGVAGLLEAWGSEGLHDAEIIPVIVSEGTDRPADSTSTFRPFRKRDEMWLGMRDLLPRPTDDDEGVAPKIRLRVDRKTVAQLTAPEYSTTASGGMTVVESKKSLKKRGMSSPDRAESILLCLYEPAPKKPKKRKVQTSMG
jgi:hypothetical protein